MPRVLISAATGLAALAAVCLMPAGPAAASTGIERVPFPHQAAAGVIVVKTSERKLYLVLGDGSALRYPVAVGMRGRQWQGTARIDGKYVEPAWSPPAEVKRAKPSLPDVIPPGPNNPMGARALTLDRGEYAIHGTSPRCAPPSAPRPPSAASACSTSTSSISTTGCAWARRWWCCLRISL